MKLDSLEKLYVHQLKDLWSAESQIAKALPRVIAKVEDDELTKALQDHLKETETQIERLETIFDSMEFGPQGHRCDGMEGLLKECGEMLQTEGERAVLDAGLIASLQRVEHYEIASYGSARAYAEKLGRKQDADLLTRSLEEEGKADRLMTQLAERSINFEAMVA